MPYEHAISKKKPKPSQKFSVSVEIMMTYPKKKIHSGQKSLAPAIICTFPTHRAEMYQSNDDL